MNLSVLKPCLYALWTLPQTLLALFILCFGAVRYERFDEVLLFSALPGGLCSKFFDGYGFSGFTCGPMIVAYKPSLLYTKRFLKHELRHVTQGWWLGPAFFVAYYGASAWSWLSGKPAYYGNWFEQDARNHELDV